jgi:hypothetical protein
VNPYPEKPLKGRAEEGIMGASQQNCIYRSRAEGLKVMGDHHLGDLPFQKPLLDERNEERAGIGIDFEFRIPATKSMLIGATSNGRLGRKNSDIAGTSDL